MTHHVILDPDPPVVLVIVSDDRGMTAGAQTVQVQGVRVGELPVLLAPLPIQAKPIRRRLTPLLSGLQVSYESSESSLLPPESLAKKSAFGSLTLDSAAYFA